jgi:cupin fold WbuC family metalloprotein
MAKIKSIKGVNFFNKKFLDERLKKFIASKDIFQRINIHNSSNDLMHIMIMFYKKNFDYPPHFSINKTESFSVIKGKFKIFFYDKNKNIKKKFILEKDNILGYKLNKNIFHKIVPLSNYCVALEVLDGPYINNSVKKIDE